MPPLRLEVLDERLPHLQNIGCCWLLLTLVVVDIGCSLYCAVGLLVVVLLVLCMLGLRLLVVGLYRVGGLLGFWCCCCCWLLLLLLLAIVAEVVLAPVVVAGCLLLLVLLVAVFVVSKLLWLSSPSSSGRHQRGTGQNHYDSARTRTAVRNTEEPIRGTTQRCK